MSTGMKTTRWSEYEVSSTITAELRNQREESRWDLAEGARHRGFGQQMRVDARNVALGRDDVFFLGLRSSLIGIGHTGADTILGLLESLCRRVCARFSGAPWHAGVGPLEDRGTPRRHPRGACSGAGDPLAPTYESFDQREPASTLPRVLQSSYLGTCTSAATVTFCSTALKLQPSRRRSRHEGPAAASALPLAECTRGVRLARRRSLPRVRRSSRVAYAVASATSRVMGGAGGRLDGSAKSPRAWSSGRPIARASLSFCFLSAF